MRQAITLWAAIYQNAAPWLAPAQRERLELVQGERVRSLNIGASVAAEFARLVLLEFQSQLRPLLPTGDLIPQEGEDQKQDEEQEEAVVPPMPVLDETQELLNADYQHFLDSFRPYMEQTCALGACLIKPYSDGAGHVFANVIPATSVFPITFAPDGTLTEVVIADRRLKGGQYYTLLEYRKFTGDSEDIQYKVYKSMYPASLGMQVSSADGGMWPDIPASGGLRIKNVPIPLFVYLKMPFANIVEPQSQLGVSIYAKAVGLLEDADIQYSRYLWEYAAGEFAINVDSSALEVDTSKRANVARLDRRIYRGVDIKDLFQAWNPSLRDSAYHDGLNNILRMIEFKCGLSYNTLSEAVEKVRTATEIISSRQRSYGAIKELQRSLEVALSRLVHVFCVIRGTSYEALEVTFEWDDSILVDEEVEKSMFLQEISAGIRFPWEYRVKFLGETEQEAKARIAENTAPQNDDVLITHEDEDEEEEDEELIESDENDIEEEDDDDDDDEEEGKKEKKEKKAKK
jgi:A118 family predicted phage portal protein